LVAPTGALILFAWLRRAAAWHRHRESPLRPLVVGPLLAVMVAVAVMSPHFIRLWVFHGNPLYPFLQDQLGGSPTVPGAAHEVEVILKGNYAWRPPGSLIRRATESIELLFAFPFRTYSPFTKGWPNFGALFTLTLPLLIWVRRPGRLVLGAGVGLMSLFCWAMLVRVDRHLQSLAPILVATTTALLVRAWALGHWARYGTACLILLEVLWSGDALFYSQQSRLSDAMSLVTSGYRSNLAQRQAYRFPFQAVNRALPPGAKVLVRPLPVSLGIDRRTVVDQAGHQGLISYAGIGGGTSLKRYYERLGITHVLVHDGVASWDKRAEILLQEFYRSTPLQRFFGLSLATVAQSRPRPDPTEYWVYVRGIAGYRDGVYALDDLGTWEPWDFPGRQFPAPRIPMPGSESGRLGLLGRSSAAVTGSGVPMGPQELAELGGRFVVAHGYRDFQVRLLR
jgi:hypothetical protein